MLQIKLLEINLNSLNTYLEFEKEKKKNEKRKEESQQILFFNKTK